MRSERNKVPTTKHQRQTIEDNIRIFDAAIDSSCSEYNILIGELKELDKELKKLKDVPEIGQKKSCNQERRDEEDKKIPSSQLFQLEYPVKNSNEPDPNSQVIQPTNSEEVSAVEDDRNNDDFETLGPQDRHK